LTSAHLRYSFEKKSVIFFTRSSVAQSLDKLSSGFFNLVHAFTVHMLPYFWDF
jgi:hypothetical protein